MELSSLKIKPKLVEVKLDSPAIIEAFGEEITFYLQDYQNIQTYFDFFKHQTDSNFDELSTVVRKILVNKNGNPILAENETLPITIMTGVINKISEHLVEADQKIRDTAKESIKKETENKPAPPVTGA